MALTDEQKIIIRKMKANHQSVSLMISRLGETHAYEIQQYIREMYGRDDYWTEEEDNIIKANLHLTSREIAALLPRRTPGTVRARQARMRAAAAREFRKDNGVLSFKMPIGLIEERDRRSQERSEMNEVALRMGDPPFSQSALARINGGAHRL